MSQELPRNKFQKDNEFIASSKEIGRLFDEFLKGCEPLIQKYIDSYHPPKKYINEKIEKVN